MTREVVRIAVLSAVGVSWAHATIPEVTDPQHPKPVPSLLPVQEQVQARWRAGLDGRLDALFRVPAVLKRSDLEALLPEVPRLLPSPMHGTYTTWFTQADGQTKPATYDLSTETGRIDAVLHCLAMVGNVDSCDLHAVLTPEVALRRARGVRAPDAAPPTLEWARNAWRWTHLAASCEAPQSGSCGHGLFIDASTGVCHQQIRCMRGRPFADGRVATLTGETRTAAGEAWALIALDEHASVASFAHHVLELLSVGAPMELVQAAIEAQADEVRHAQLALELAAHFGAEVELGPLDTAVPIQVGLEAILLQVARTGCLEETLAAVECAIALEETTEPRVREVLTVLVDDEARHAALAWRTLQWGLPQLAPTARARVLAVFSASQIVPAQSVPPGIGVLGGEGARRARLWALDQVVLPALERVGRRTA